MRPPRYKVGDVKQLLDGSWTATVTRKGYKTILSFGPSITLEDLLQRVLDVLGQR